MNGFKKLILTSAILVASGSAFAMQAMDESSLSDTTGQDGLSININSSDISNLGVTWIDRDGITTGGSTYTNPGAVVINNMGVTINNLGILVDAGSAAADDGQLKVAISTTNDIFVWLNDRSATATTGNGTVIGVTSAGATGSAVGVVTPILKFASDAKLQITGGISADIRLGNRAVGEHFMNLDFQAPINVSLTGLSILDAVSTTANAGADVGISIGNIGINGLDVHAAVDVVPTGLRIDTAGTSIGSVALESIKLGDLTLASTKSIGDVYLTGLTANSVITISGH